MKPEPDQHLQVGQITVHPERYEVYVNQERIDLTLTQFRLLTAMARRPGWVVTAEQFQQRFGKVGGETPSGSRNVKHHIAALRRKLGVAAWQVQTVRGEGYRLTDTQPKHSADSPVSRADAVDA